MKGCRSFVQSVCVGWEICAILCKASFSNLRSLKERRLRKDLIVMYKLYNGLLRLNVNDLLIKSSPVTVKGNVY